MSYFPTTDRMARARPSLSTTSSSNSSSSSTPWPYSSRPGSSPACYSSPSTTSSSPSSYNIQYGGHNPRHSRHSSNGTSYLPTPFGSSLLHSTSTSSFNAPSSYFSDDELLSLDLESTPLTSAHSPSRTKREMTTEEQVAAVREQLEREREGAKPEAWLQQRVPGQAAAALMEKRSRVVRFPADTRSSAAPSGSGSGRRTSGQQIKRRSVVISGTGRGSSRRD